jgi:hypothetical protein
LIQDNEEITTDIYTNDEPLRLCVIGNVQGSSYKQYFNSDDYGYIFGEALLTVTDEYLITSATFLLEPETDTSFRVISFESTGNIPIVNFTAFTLEVYR